jgi:hypothetical protein
MISETTYLPVFIVEPADVDKSLDAFAQQFGLSGLRPDEVGDLKIYRRGSHRLDVNPKTGEAWYEDEDKLWKPDFSEERLRAARKRVSTRAIADQARAHFAGMTAIGLTPPVATDSVLHPVIEAPLDSVAMRCVLKDRKGPDFTKRKVHTLDSYVAATSYMEVPDPQGLLPLVKARMVGRGLRRGIAFGTDGAILNAHATATRRLRPLPDEAAIRMEVSQEQFRASLSSARQLHTLTSELAYELRETGDYTILWPVWLHRASIVGNEGILDLPIVALPASTYGPVPPQCLALPSVQAAPLPGHFGKTGAWWLEDAGIHAERNANGFLKGMSEKWEIFANRGNDATLKEDWLAQAATKGVDLTDLAFYAGHANASGWCFNKLEVCSMVSNSDVGDGDKARALYGQRLKWLAVCACGPLQDDQKLNPKFADAFKRWGNMFDGLRTLLGFATQIADRCEIGERFADRLGSHTVIDAWMRAARENQVGGTTASTCAVSSALYAFNQGEEEPLLDRFNGGSLPQMGSKSPTIFTAIWTPA